MHRLEAGQPVAEPTDRRLRMPLLAFASHTVRGLDRHDVPATAGKPAGIAARAGSSVEDEARPFGDEVERVLVAVLERRALVEAASTLACLSYAVMGSLMQRLGSCASSTLPPAFLANIGRR